MGYTTGAIKMNINKIPIHVLTVLGDDHRELSREEIERLTPNQIFIEYCEWHGLIGWGSTLITVLDEIRESAK